MGRQRHAYGAFDGPHSADRVVQALAGRQHGIITRDQARAAGLTRQGTRRRVEAGRLIRLYDGVYAVGHTALTTHGGAQAAGEGRP